MIKLENETGTQYIIQRHERFNSSSYRATS